MFVAPPADSLLQSIAQELLVRRAYIALSQFAVRCSLQIHLSPHGSSRIENKFGHSMVQRCKRAQSKRSEPSSLKDRQWLRVAEEILKWPKEDVLALIERDDFFWIDALQHFQK